jgi:DNA polymerase III epsilon subunit-like protein
LLEDQPINYRRDDGGMMDNVMLDLETMGTDPDAAIIAVGAVRFDLEAGSIGEKFYAVVDLQSAVANGGVINPSTVLWWMQQGDAARSAFARPGHHIADVLASFTKWLGDEDAFVWGNGAAFDNVILATAYRNANLPVPWKFYNDRCYRTVRAQYPAVSMQRRGTFHNAVDDAESQARHLIDMIGPHRAPATC